MVFKRHRIECARDIVAFILRWDEFGILLSGSRIPAEKLSAISSGAWCSRKSLSDRVHEPFSTWVMSRLGKPEAILARGHHFRIVGRATYGHGRALPAPFLVLQSRLMQADGIVKFGEKTARVLDKVDCRALMRSQAMAVHLEFVLFGLPAKDCVIFEHKDARVRGTLSEKEES